MNSHINQNSTTSNSKNSRKPYYIILGLLYFLIIIFGIANIYKFTTKNNSASNNINVSDTNDSTDNASSLTAFEDLTKEEALAFLRAQTNITGTLPKNYVRKEISNAVITNGDTIVSDLDLIYSYDTLKDLKEIAKKEYSGFNLSNKNNAKEYDDNNFEIKEHDYYAIVTPKRVKKATSCDQGYNNDCNSLLSFKRSYLDYHQEETTSNSNNDAFHFNTKDPDIINYLLRVCTFFSHTGSGRHDNIYSYNFEEQNNKYILTVNYIGAGVNIELLKKLDNHTNNSETHDINLNNSDMYGINLYLERFAANKSDGHIYTIPTETGATEDVRSFPITEEEMRSLPWYDD